MREYTNDELAKLTNERLRELFLRVRGTINRAKREARLSTKEEIYFCYICRELEKRSVRR